MSSFQPGVVINLGLHTSYSSVVGGMLLISLPFNIYLLQILISSKPDKTSRSVTNIKSIPEVLIAYFKATASNQPTLRGLFVLEPYSLPRSLMMFASSLNNSVGNPPAPTLVQYALTTPKVFWISL